MESHWEERGGEVIEVSEKDTSFSLSINQNFGKGVLFKTHFLCMGDLIFKGIIVSEW